MTDVRVPHRYRHRRVFTVLAFVLAALLLTVELLLFSSYQTGTRTTRDLDDGTNATTTMASVHREVLEIRMAANRRGDESAIKRDVELHRGLLDQQMTVVAGHAQTQPILRAAVPGMRSTLWQMDAIARQPRGIFGAEYAKLGKQLDQHVKQVFDDQEHALYETLSSTVEARQDSQRLLVGLGGGALLLGGLLAFGLRRAIRRDFSRAYDALAHEVEERKELHSELERQAGQDALTELANRRRFVELLEEALRRSRGRDGAVAVIYADLDGFKVINDAFGHAGGDAVLHQVASRLRNCVRPGDAVARLGGDEFAVLLQDLSTESDAHEIAERLLHTLRVPFLVGEHGVRVGASVGLALSHAGSDADDLIREADEAMYTAKEETRGSCHVLDPRVRTSMGVRREFERELREAVEADRLDVHYQPIVELNGGSIVGHEALVRWQHDERGLLLPGEFLATAEHAGLMVALGSYVLEQSCVAAAAGGPGSWISVNIAPAQLHDPQLPRHVELALERAGCDPRRLVLELSEHALLRDAHLATRALEELSALGVRVAIDDFGTGHASLSYFRFLPISLLKLDSSFVRDLATEPESRRLAAAILELAGSLDLATVAEGIEHPEQRRHLLQMGCAMGQGFLFAHPHPDVLRVPGPVAL